MYNYNNNNNNNNTASELVPEWWSTWPCSRTSWQRCSWLTIIQQKQALIIMHWPERPVSVSGQRR